MHCAGLQTFQSQLSFSFQLFICLNNKLVVREIPLSCIHLSVTDVTYFWSWPPFFKFIIYLCGRHSQGMHLFFFNFGFTNSLVTVKMRRTVDNWHSKLDIWNAVERTFGHFHSSIVHSIQCTKFHCDFLLCLWNRVRVCGPTAKPQQVRHAQAHTTFRQSVDICCPNTIF